MTDDNLYEELRDNGAEGDAYEDRTKEDLEGRAAEVGIEGPSRMDKRRLIDGWRNH